MSDEKELEQGADEPQKGAEEDTKTPEFEADARRQGWVSKEEWEAKGKDPAKHKSAEKFIKDGEQIVPILKGRLTRLENQLNTLKQTQVKERKATLEAMADQNKINEAKLKEALKAAVSKGDGDAVVDLQDRLDAAKEQSREIKQELKTVEQPAEDPQFVQFLEENEWYSTDKELQDEADTVGAIIRRKNPTMPAAEFYEKVVQRVKTLHPDKFGRKPKAPDQATRGGDGGSKQKGVPKDTRQQFEAMSKMVPAADRKAFMDRMIANYTANEE